MIVNTQYVHPDIVDLSSRTAETQVAMFRHARIIAGFAGSAMFTLCFCEAKRVIMIWPETYASRNELLICSAIRSRCSGAQATPSTRLTAGPPRPTSPRTHSTSLVMGPDWLRRSKDSEQISSLIPATGTNDQRRFS
jgi:hypothetical protein